METIKKLRETMGITMTTMSRMMGLKNSQNYSNWELRRYEYRNKIFETAIKLNILKRMAQHIEEMKQLEPEILTAIENLKNEIK